MWTRGVWDIAETLKESRRNGEDRTCAVAYFQREEKDVLVTYFLEEQQIFKEKSESKKIHFIIKRIYSSAASGSCTIW